MRSILSMETMTVAEYLAQQNKQKPKREHPEHDEQVKVFEWAKIMQNKIPELELLMAIPNGAFYGGHWSVARRMKEEGVRSGVPDIFLPVIKMDLDIHDPHIYGGLWIEMKVGKNKPSEEQKWWIEKLTHQGYVTVVCYSAEEAIKEIQNYLNSKNE